MRSKSSSTNVRSSRLITWLDIHSWPIFCQTFSFCPASIHPLVHQSFVNLLRSINRISRGLLCRVDLFTVCRARSSPARHPLVHQSFAELLPSAHRLTIHSLTGYLPTLCLASIALRCSVDLFVVPADIHSSTNHFPTSALCPASTYLSTRQPSFFNLLSSIGRIALL